MTTDRIESDREAIYRRLYAVWPEWTVLGPLGDVLEDAGRSADSRAWTAINVLYADGRIEREPGRYRVRMGLS